MLNKDFLIRKFNSLFNFSRNILTHVYKKGFFHLLSANYLAAFLAFITQMLIAWWLTPADIGRIKVLQSILGIMVVFSGLCFLHVRISHYYCCVPQYYISIRISSAFKGWSDKPLCTVVYVGFITLYLLRFFCKLSTKYQRV